jgi:hypothetical protein
MTGFGFGENAEKLEVGVRSEKVLVPLQAIAEMVVSESTPAPVDLDLENPAEEWAQVAT